MSRRYDHALADGGRDLAADQNDPIRLPIAAITSAIRGVSARVDTLVAIALAASWKPLV